MVEVVICEPLRTPIGKYGGVLKDVPAETLATTVVSELVRRTSVPVEKIDEVVLGNCYPSSDAPALGRVVALDAGLPISTTGVQIDRRCGSGLQAILYAGMQVATGFSNVVVAGGAESMSRAPFYTTSARWGLGNGPLTYHDSLARGRVTAGGRNYPVAGGMLETAENLRRTYAISRQEQDELAATSHARATRAQQAGVFAEEIVAIEAPGRRSVVTVEVDEHPRPDTSVESLAALRPVLSSVDPEATVTAGNASGQNDAAAACIVTSRSQADGLGLRPLGRIVSSAVAGVPPSTMGIGPVPATELALQRAGLTLAEIDLIELNEAFAAQVLACTREWRFGRVDFDRLNVHGSGISLGHPVGATGCRMVATLLREMARRQARYGLVTMCIGGGQGLAAVFERVAEPC